MPTGKQHGYWANFSKLWRYQAMPKANLRFEMAAVLCIRYMLWAEMAELIRVCSLGVRITVVLKRSCMSGLS